jgi:hypothetical protein
MAPKKTTAKAKKKILKRPAKLKSKKTKKRILVKALPKKAALKTSAPAKPAPKKPVQKSSRKKRPSSNTGRRSRRPEADVLLMKKGPGPDAGGQDGDVQGLSNEESVASESVEELAEEGQGFEAAFVDGVENAPDPDQAEVKTKEVPEDDVPPEYLENE